MKVDLCTSLSTVFIISINPMLLLSMLFLSKALSSHQSEKTMHWGSDKIILCLRKEQNKKERTHGQEEEVEDDDDDENDNDDIENEWDVEHLDFFRDFLIKSSLLRREKSSKKLKKEKKRRLLLCWKWDKCPPSYEIVWSGPSCEKESN